MDRDSLIFKILVERLKRQPMPSKRHKMYVLNEYIFNLRNGDVEHQASGPNEAFVVFYKGNLPQGLIKFNVREGIIKLNLVKGLKSGRIDKANRKFWYEVLVESLINASAPLLSKGNSSRFEFTGLFELLARRDKLQIDFDKIGYPQDPELKKKERELSEKIRSLDSALELYNTIRDRYFESISTQEMKKIISLGKEFRAPKINLNRKRVMEILKIYELKKLKFRNKDVRNKLKERKIYVPKAK